MIESKKNITPSTTGSALDIQTPKTMRKAIPFALLLFLYFVLTPQLFADFDFSATVPSGQTLYFKYVTTSSGREVSVTYAKYDDGSISNGYYGFSAPTGDLTIPDSVRNSSNGRTYAITIIDSFTFMLCTSLTSVTIPNSVTTIGEYNQEIKGETNVEVIPVST